MSRSPEAKQEAGLSWRREVASATTALALRQTTTYDLHRLLFERDLHIGDRFRTFIQFSNHDVTSASLSPGTDVDQIDLQQGFADLKTMPVRAVPGLHVDLCYLGIDRWKVAFNTSTANETRHTPNWSTSLRKHRNGCTSSSSTGTGYMPFKERYYE